MKTFTHQHFSLTLPDNWVVEKETDYTSLYQQDGVGDLLISSFHYEHEVTEEDLEEFAAEHFDNNVDAADVDFGDFNGFFFCYDTNAEYLCEWYLKSAGLMLFITYSCPLEDEDNSEADIAETILNSLQAK
mgnify:CR=1 FL=1